MAKVSPEVCWFGLGEALELVYVCETGRGGHKSTVCGTFSRVHSPLNCWSLSILGLLLSPRRRGGLCPAEMLYSFVELPLCGETCLQ